MKKQLILLLLSVVSLVCSCKKQANVEGLDFSRDSINVNIVDVPSTPTIANMNDEEFKGTVSEYLRSRFGKLAKVTKWKSCDKWENNKAVILSGEASAVVRGDKATYTFDAILNEYGRVTSLQMNHKGTYDAYYNLANGVRLDDNIIKSPVNYKGIRVRTIGIREAGIRYVTSGKMNKNQIMDFIVNYTDMKNRNYYFQMSENSYEYAQYNGDEDSGTLCVYCGSSLNASGKTYVVEIDDKGKVSITNFD